MSKKRVAIIGGGISGLTLAHELEKTSDAEVVLYEASHRLGGKIETDSGNGMVVERGPDCFFTGKPGAKELVEELGIEDDLIEPQQRQFSLFIDGSLQSVPPGLLTFTHLDPSAVKSASFLSEMGRRQVLNEASAPASSEDDESIATFFRRRFGEEFSRTVAETLLAGTHGGDPEALSVRALYPGYWKLEKDYGSLSAAPKPTGQKSPMFLSFRRGMQTLTDALSGRLRWTDVRLRTPVTEIGSGGNVYTQGEPEQFDNVVLTTPAHLSARILESVNPEASGLLRQIPFADAVIVTFELSAQEVGDRMTSTGFLVPGGAMRPVTGATFSSAKWSDRCRAGTALIRVFLGRSGWPEVREMSDGECASSAMKALERALGTEVSARSSFVNRMPNSLPQYLVGHVELMKSVHRALESTPFLSICCTSCRGVGIPDCIVSAKQHAAELSSKPEQVYV